MRTIDRKRELTLLEFESAATVPAMPEVVSGIVVDGQRPSVAGLDKIRRELAKVPKSILREWRDRGGRVEVIAGLNASRHPEAVACRLLPSMGWHGGTRLRDLIVVSEQCSETTPLHEFGHFHDRGGRFSWSREWRELLRVEKAWSSSYAPGAAPFSRDYHLSTEGESFAQAFAMCYHSEFTRSQLSKPMRRFVEVSVGQ
jgi:hypothetical protein